MWHHPEVDVPLPSSTGYEANIPLLASQLRWPLPDYGALSVSRGHKTRMRSFRGSKAGVRSFLVLVCQK